VQEEVRNDNCQPWRDPVGDQQQEVFVLAARRKAGLQQEPDPEPDGAEDEGRDRPPSLNGQVDAQGEERHRSGVDVQDVRGDGSTGDAEQNQDLKPDRKRIGELLGWI
jgi:hypothetical protein